MTKKITRKVGLKGLEEILSPFSFAGTHQAHIRTYLISQICKEFGVDLKYGTDIVDFIIKLKLK